MLFLVPPFLRVLLNKKIATQAIECLVVSCWLYICVEENYLGGVFEGQDPPSYGTYWRYEVQQVNFSDFFPFFSKLSSTSLTSIQRVRAWFQCS